MAFRHLLLLVAAQLCIVAGIPGKFLSAEPEENLVNPREITAELDKTFEALLGVGSMAEYAERMAFVEKAIWQTFQALPKNKQGRLAPRAVRHLMHRYFSKVHGWTIEGLKGSINGMEGLLPEAGKLGNRIGILADTVPAVIETALEARQAGRGLSMTEVVAFAVAIERLVMEESVKILVNSFEVNSISTRETISREKLEDVMTTYASHFSIDGPVNVTDAKITENWEKYQARDVLLADNTVTAQDLVHDFAFASRDVMNPFRPASYSFEWTSKLLSTAGNSWGRTLDLQCHELREAFAEMDVEGTGRVSLQAFKDRQQVSTFLLRESEQTLRDIGALDESIPGKPTVRVANYVMSPSNCGEYSGYYSVCCRDHCAGIVEQLEGLIQAPVVDAEVLLYAVGNLSSTGDDLEGPASPLFGPNGQNLRERMAVIATKNGGQVPLHGRMFAQWLHYAYPAECPHPIQALQRITSRVLVSSEHFLASNATTAALPVEPTVPASTELIEKMKINTMDIVMAVAPKQWELVPQWTEEESNPLLDEILNITNSQPGPGAGSLLQNIMRFVALLAFFAVALHTGFHGFQTAAVPNGGYLYKAQCKADDYSVPKDF